MGLSAEIVDVEEVVEEAGSHSNFYLQLSDSSTVFIDHQLPKVYKSLTCCISKISGFDDQ